MRTKFAGLGLAATLLILIGVAWAQGGAGFFQSPSCSTLSNPVTGSTVCWQTSPPNSWFYWNGASFIAPSLGGPYAPSDFTSGALLQGGGTGPITATLNPQLMTLRLVASPATVGLQITAQYGGFEPYGTAPGNTGELYFRELAANGLNFVSIKAPDSLAANAMLVLPTTTGTNGYALVTDGANPAQLSWASIGGGGGSGITSLGGLGAAVQTFANDTNVTITSSVSTHTLGWTGTLSVARGGLGVGTLAANGILYGNGTGAVQVTAAGSADQVLRVPGAGNPPAFGAVDVSKAAAITGLVRTANLGSGTPDATTFLRGDQTWASPTSTATTPTNYGFNTSYETWGSGTSSAPTGWATSSCSTVAKNTTAGQFKLGAASMALTRSAGTCLATQNIAATYAPIGYWQSQSVVLGGWVRCTVGARGFLEINDGVSTTTSAAHTGGSTFEFLSVPATIGGGATKVEIRAKVDAGSTTCQFDGLILAKGSSITAWTPDAWQGRKAMMIFSSGDSFTLSNAVTNYFNFLPSTIETAVEYTTPFKGVARNLSCRTSIDPASVSSSYLFQLRVNEANASPQATVIQSTQQGNDATNEAEIAKFARVAMSSTPANAPVAVAAACTMEYEEIP